FELKHGLINMVQNKHHLQQRFDESFYEAWERFNDLLRACPHHGFSELHQLDTFYNALNVNGQDLLNSAAGGTFLEKMPRECLKIIESKSKVHQSRAKAIVAKVGTSSSTPAISSDVVELKDTVKALLLVKKNQSPAPTPSNTLAPVKAFEPNCVTCGGAHAYQNCPATHENAYRDNMQEYVSQAATANYNQGNTGFRPQMTQRVSQTDFESYVKANDAILRNMQSQGQSTQNQCQNIQNQYQNLQIQMDTLTDMMSKFVSANTASSSGSRTLPGNTITNPKEDLKGITTRSGVAYQGSKTPSPSKQRIKVTKDQVKTPSSQNTAPIQPSVIQSESQAPVFEPVVAPVSAPMPNLKPSIPYPSRRDNENAEKLSEMARTTMNEHCSAVILNKLPRKLGDPGKFLIPCKFSRMDECLALADLGASINLMPFSVWKALSLPELTPTCMTLELADRSVSKPIGIAKDVSFKVGVFHFPVDFVVIDFEPDPRVPLILGRCFLKTNRALIHVHKGELTLRIGMEAITYNLDQTVRYSANYNQMTANRIDFVCEEYSQEVLGFSDTTVSGNPTPIDDPIVSTNSPTFTPFEDSDFLLFEEADAFLAFLNSEPLPPFPNHEQYLPSYKMELKVCEAKTIKSSVDEPPEVELKDLPHHLEYAFL
nr:reverse transcriptase domain-containing protein [Tanacetum cinerariifolium]